MTADLDLNLFPAAFSAVMQLIPDDLAALWWRRLEAAPGTTVLRWSGEDGWFDVLVDGDRAMQLHETAFDPAAETAEARVWVDGARRDVGLGRPTNN